MAIGGLSQSGFALWMTMTPRGASNSCGEQRIVVMDVFATAISRTL
jgi:hypothetical protein